MAVDCIGDARTGSISIDVMDYDLRPSEPHEEISILMQLRRSSSITPKETNRHCSQSTHNRLIDVFRYRCVFFAESFKNEDWSAAG